MFSLEKYGDSSCLEDGERSYSYAKVNQIAELLVANLSVRSLILCACENTISSLIGYIAFVHHGHVPILVDASQSSAVLKEIIAEYKPSYMWVSIDRVSEFDGCETVYSFDGYSLCRLRLVGDEVVKLHESLQLLLSTSGSTGSKKFVRISKKNLLSNATSIIDYLDIRVNDIAITTLPFSYSYGMSVVNCHILVGASIQVTKYNVLQKEFWDLVKNRHVTSLSGVPYTFDMLRRIKFERLQVRSIRYLTQAGGKLSQDGLMYLQHIAEKLKISCFVMYGQTEASPRMSYLPAQHLNKKLGSIGVPVDCGYFEVVTQKGEIVTQPNLSGELIYYGPNVAMGYALNFNDLARGDDWNGRLQTGDVGYFDEDGYYYITGRLKRFIKIYGNRISLDEVEAALNNLFRLSEFVCFGSDDRLAIGCVGTAENREVVDYVARSFLINRLAIKFITLNEIPRLENGKLDFNLLSTYT